MAEIAKMVAYSLMDANDKMRSMFPPEMQKEVEAKMIAEMSDEEWRDVLDTNLFMGRRCRSEQTALSLWIGAQADGPTFFFETTDGAPNSRVVAGNSPFSTYFTQVRNWPTGTSCSVLQATVQAWQPMHVRWSMANP